MAELRETMFVRVGDIVRWSGLDQRTIRKMAKAGAFREVRPVGMKVRMYERESVLQAFRRAR